MKVRIISSVGKKRHGRQRNCENEASIDNDYRLRSKRRRQSSMTITSPVAPSPAGLSTARLFPFLLTASPSSDRSIVLPRALVDLRRFVPRPGRVACSTSSTSSSESSISIVPVGNDAFVESAARALPLTPALTGTLEEPLGRTVLVVETGRGGEAVGFTTGAGGGGGGAGFA